MQRSESAADSHVQDEASRGPPDWKAPIPSERAAYRLFPSPPSRSVTPTGVRPVVRVGSKRKARSLSLDETLTKNRSPTHTRHPSWIVSSGMRPILEPALASTSTPYKSQPHPTSIREEQGHGRSSSAPEEWRKFASDLSRKAGLKPLTSAGNAGTATSRPQKPSMPPRPIGLGLTLRPEALSPISSNRSTMEPQSLSSRSTASGSMTISSTSSKHDAPSPIHTPPGLSQKRGFHPNLRIETGKQVRIQRIALEKPLPPPPPKGADSDSESDYHSALSKEKSRRDSPVSPMSAASRPMPDRDAKAAQIPTTANQRPASPVSAVTNDERGLPPASFFVPRKPITIPRKPVRPAVHQTATAPPAPLSPPSSRFQVRPIASATPSPSASPRFRSQIRPIASFERTEGPRRLDLNKMSTPTITTIPPQPPLFKPALPPPAPVPPPLTIPREAPPRSKALREVPLPLKVSREAPLPLKISRELQPPLNAPRELQPPLNVPRGLQPPLNVHREVPRETGQSVGGAQRETRQPAREAQRATSQPFRDTQREMNQPDKEAQREVDQPVREAQREVYQPVREAQREVDQPVREAQREVDQPVREAQREVYQPVREAQREVNQPVRKAQHETKQSAGSESTLDIPAAQADLPKPEDFKTRLAQISQRTTEAALAGKGPEVKDESALLATLKDLSKQSEALHVRYKDLRAERQKLSSTIIVSLKEGKPGPDYTNLLLDRHIGLSAITSSMDICFAKLKSLDCRKEEALTALLVKVSPKRPTSSSRKSDRAELQEASDASLVVRPLRPQRSNNTFQNAEGTSRPTEKTQSPGSYGADPFRGQRPKPATGLRKRSDETMARFLHPPAGEKRDSSLNQSSKAPGRNDDLNQGIVSPRSTRVRGAQAANVLGLVKEQVDPARQGTTTPPESLSDPDNPAAHLVISIQTLKTKKKTTPPPQRPLPSLPERKSTEDSMAASASSLASTPQDVWTPHEVTPTPPSGKDAAGFKPDVRVFVEDDLLDYYRNAR